MTENLPAPTTMRDLATLLEGHASYTVTRNGHFRAQSGFRVKLPNGWAVSVQFGAANYADHYGHSGTLSERFELVQHDCDGTLGEPFWYGSTTAEIAAVHPNGHLVEITPGWTDEDGDYWSGDTVRGWVPVAEILAFIDETAERPGLALPEGDRDDLIAKLDAVFDEDLVLVSGATPLSLEG